MFSGVQMFSMFTIWYISDDLTKVAEIGELVEVIGTVRKDISDDKITWTVEVRIQNFTICFWATARSAWVSTQSDQSLHCPHEEALGP